ncbi:hypothetical protein F4811DRAFT_533706 [Daldinia bambusicola]|nr:hypothetical protein F4811DRAFT_533706 [Daldinia bambusicola]
MSTSRLFTSSLRTVARRTAASAPAQRQLALSSTARRAYSSSGHGGSAGAEKSSDMPWLIGSVAVTVPALAWILSSGPDKKTSSKTHGGAPVPDEEKAPAVESGDDSSSSSASSALSSISSTLSPSSSSDSSDKSSSSDDSSSSSSSSSPSNYNSTETPPPTNQLPKDGNPLAAFGSSQTGRTVVPPAADNTDMATNYEDKKRGHEEYKEMIRRKDTRMAASSSDVPSKKQATEHPREDPQKGEGEGVQKGGPAR